MRSASLAALVACVLCLVPASVGEAATDKYEFPKLLTVRLDIQKLLPVTARVGPGFSFNITVNDLPKLIALRDVLAELQASAEPLVVVFERDRDITHGPSYHFNHSRGLVALGGTAHIYLPSTGGGGEDGATETVLHLQIKTHAGELSVYTKVTLGYPGKIEAGEESGGTFKRVESVNIRGKWEYANTISAHPLAEAEIGITIE